MNDVHTRYCYLRQIAITGIYEGNSISKLQIQVATYVFELSAGNCHRYNYICSRNMVLKSKNGGKTEFYRNGFLATLGSTFQEG
jgi:hypothetical protein